MKIKIIHSFVSLLILSVCISLYGCKKDKVKEPGCRITKISEGATGSGYIINHDVNGRLQSVTYGNSTTVTNFSYSENKVAELSTGNNGYYNKSTHTLNSNGLVSHSKIEYDAAGTQWQTRDYVYIGTQLSKSTLIKSTGNNSTTNYNWNNGNLITSIRLGANFSQKIDYEYYQDKPYQLGDSHSWDLIIYGIEKIRSKNLLRKRISTYTENNTSSVEIISYSYAFGSDGKIISLTETQENTSQPPVTFTYTYQCK